MRVAEHAHADARDEVEVGAAARRRTGACPRRGRTPRAAACRSAARAALRAPVTVCACRRHPSLHHLSCVGASVFCSATSLRQPLGVAAVDDHARRCTPPLSAARHAVSLATMPAFAVPDFDQLRDRRARRARRSSGPAASSTPACRRRSPAACAFSRAARLPASVSALTLNSCPSFDGARRTRSPARSPRAQQTREQRRRRALVPASPTRPRSTVSPLVALCGARLLRPAPRRHRRRSARRPCRRPR